MKKRSAQPSSSKPEAPVAKEGVERLFPIVGVGASAGGLEGFTQLLENLPTDTGMAFVFIQHLAPEQESMLTDILARSSKMPVHTVRDNMKVEPNNVYVIPPKVSMTIRDGTLILQPMILRSYRPVDQFLVSLAQERKNLAIGVILSGTGSDGTEGLKAIHAEGGITFAQDEGSAKYSGMPHSAVAAGVVHFVLPPPKIVEELVRIARHPSLSRPEPKVAGVEAEAEEGDDVRSVLTMLRLTFGVDFNLYKTSTINRRIARRLVIHKMDDMKDYLRYLRDHKEELQALFDDMLIGVTSFFREPETFKILRERVLPTLFKDRPASSPIRVWVPGCSTGEETYSIGILLREFVEESGTNVPIQIFGTDVNDKNIDKARQGIYGEDVAENVSDTRLKHFFTRVDRGYQVNKTIRDMCVFAKQDLAKDPPFSNLDLISCRNVLIYFKPELQKKIIPLFHYALKPNGFLVLGISEGIGSFDDLFTPVNKEPIFSRKAGPARLGFPVEAFVERPSKTAAKAAPAVKPMEVLQREVERLLTNMYAPPGVLINEGGEVLAFRGDTTSYLQHFPGEASLNLLKMAKNELRPDLQTILYRVKKAKALVRQDSIQLKQNGQSREISIEAIPVKIPELNEASFLILFIEAQPEFKPRKQLPAEKKAMEKTLRDRETEDMRRELAATKENLQTIIEEQEATNEELRAALEEVQSSNEELQSTNEELETAKEELQSTNEELNTLNEELANRNRDIGQAVNDLTNVFNNINVAVIILGVDLKIRLFTPVAEKLFNLISSDVGRPLNDIRLGLKDVELLETTKRVMDNLVSVEKEVEDEHGRCYLMRVRPYLTTEKKIDGAVLSFVDITEIVNSRNDMERAKSFSETIIESIRDPIMVLDSDLHVVLVNNSFYETFQAEPEETLNKLIYNLGNGQWNIPKLRQLLEEILPKENTFNNYVVEHDFPEIGRRTFILDARKIKDTTRKTNLVLLGFEDVTESKRMEEEIKSIARFPSENPYPVIRIGRDGTILYSNPACTSLIGESLCSVGQQAPEHWRKLALETINSGEMKQIDETHGDKTFSFTFVPITDSGYVNVYGKDITERKQMEDKLQEYSKHLETLVDEKTKQLKDSERLSAIGQTAGMVGHDMRNPLQAISGSIYLMKDDVASLPESTEKKDMQELIISIESGILYIDRIVADLQDYARPMKPALKEFDLKTLLEETLKGTAIPDNIETTLEVDKDLNIRADPDMLRRALANLTENAVQAMPNGGHLTIKAHKKEKDITINLSDTGTGISEEVKPKLFTPLFTTKSKGQGFGLSVCKRIIEAHNGEITFQSKTGNGTTFTIKIPQTQTN